MYCRISKFGICKKKSMCVNFLSLDRPCFFHLPNLNFLLENLKNFPENLSPSRAEFVIIQLIKKCIYGIMSSIAVDRVFKTIICKKLNDFFLALKRELEFLTKFQIPCDYSDTLINITNCKALVYHSNNIGYL
jgi:hypothetical protein